MKRFIDEPYFSYAAFGKYASGLDVKCPKCCGQGVVTANRGISSFQCMHCGYAMTKEQASYRYDVRNLCVHCGRYYRLDINEPDRQRFPVLRVACPYCGTVMLGRVRKKQMAPVFYISKIKAGREPFFGLELWFLASFRGRPVWALNREHLAYLIDYLSADLREKPCNMPGPTQADHLPTFMKTAKNRERIVKLLKKMQEG